MNTNYIKRSGDTRIIAFATSDDDTSYTILPPAMYKAGELNGLFSKTIYFDLLISQDNLIKFTSGVIKDTIDLVATFLSPKIKEDYTFLKVSHKLGMILYGPPGTGKTSAAMLIMDTLITKYEAIGIDCTGKTIGSIKNIIAHIRKYQANPIVLFIDEIDNSIDAEEYAYLPFLDGSDSFNNIIILGATNFIENIPDRIKNRKSRIKYLIEVKSFPSEVYKQFIKEKLGEHISKEQLEAFAYLAVENCLTLDELKHAVIDFYIEKTPIDKAIKEVKKLNLKEENN